jgi:hypothetical protein
VKSKTKNEIKEIIKENNATKKSMRRSPNAQHKKKESTVKDKKNSHKTLIFSALPINQSPKYSQTAIAYAAIISASQVDRGI